MRKLHELCFILLLVHFVFAAKEPWLGLKRLSFSKLEMTCLNNMDWPKVILFVKNHFVKHNGHIAKVVHNLTVCNTIKGLQNEAVECNCVDKDRVVCTITGIQYISEGDEWRCATYHDGKPVYSNTVRVDISEISSQAIDEQSMNVIVSLKPGVTTDAAKIGYPYSTNIEHIVTTTDMTHIFKSYATTKKSIAPLTMTFYVIGGVILLFVIVIGVVVFRSQLPIRLPNTVDVHPEISGLHTHTKTPETQQDENIYSFAKCVPDVPSPVQDVSSPGEQVPQTVEDDIEDDPLYSTVIHRTARQI